MSTALLELLKKRHIATYGEFVPEYRRKSAELGLADTTPAPSKATFHRWLSGQNGGLPRGSHCLVLERMFPGWTAEQLFGPAESDPVGGLTSSPGVPRIRGLLATDLEGWWVTAYQFHEEGNRVLRHHADISRVTAIPSGRIIARNDLPSPRTQDHEPAFVNDVDCDLEGRYLIGRWRNLSDNYYFGSLHLIVLPGENMMRGSYTSNLDALEIDTQPWTWVRIDSTSLEAVDLSAAHLRDPEAVYAAVTARTHYDPPIVASEILEN